jgi:SAM-dependent methyltransferase
MPVPLLFDRRALALRRARASAAPADFLVRHVAADIADRLTTILRPFERVVEIGSLSTALRDALPIGPGGRYLRIGPDAGRPDIVAEEDALPLAPERADLVVSALSLQAVNDLPGALVQIRRSLRPDGLFLGALLGGDTLTELRQAFTQAEAEIEGGASPRVSPFGDVRDLGALLQRAGFALPVADSEVLRVRYRDAFALMADLRAMGATNVLAARRRTPTRRTTMLRMAAIYGERFGDPDGRIRATFEIVHLSGWAPHASQQRPLKPGSAKMRLSDALKPHPPG